MKPDALIVAAITRDEVIGAIQPIERSPLGFRGVQWFGRESFDAGLIDLLPPKELEVSHADLELMRLAFEENAYPGSPGVEPDPKGLRGVDALDAHTLITIFD